MMAIYSSPIFECMFRILPISVCSTYVYMNGAVVSNRVDLFFAIPVGGTAFFRIFVHLKANTKYYHTR